MSLTRVTPKQRHANIRSLAQRIRENKTKDFVIAGTKDDIINRFGNILEKDGRNIIVVKGKIYSLVFSDIGAILNTTAIDREELG